VFAGAKKILWILRNLTGMRQTTIHGGMASHGGRSGLNVRGCNRGGIAPSTEPGLRGGMAPRGRGGITLMANNGEYIDCMARGGLNSPGAARASPVR
jgi:hypothetical protein